MDWSDDLIEWVYGLDDPDDDEPESPGEIYRHQEEEDRIRWIPGYREAVEEYLAELRKWHASWDRQSDYPEMPDRVQRLMERISEWQKQRVEHA